MKKLKKIFSLLLAAALVTAALPFAGLTSAAESEETALSDGSKWLVDLGSTATLEVNNAGDYKIAATDESNSSFKIMPKAGFMALTDSVDLSCDYRGDAPSFGFKAECSLDGIGGTGNPYGKVEFYRLDIGSNYAVIQMFINGQPVNVTDAFVSTRAAMREISIVEENGSYYAKYGYKTINGEGLSDEVKNAVKLENYFPKELLANNGMLYFFCTAESVGTVNGARLIVHNTIDDYTRIYSHEFSGDNNNPGNWTVTPTQGSASAQFNYIANGAVAATYDLNEFNAGAGGTSAVYGLPVTVFNNGSTTSEKFTTFCQTYLVGHWAHYDFSNDPTFADGSYNTLDFYSQDQSYIHVIYNGTTLNGVGGLLNIGWYGWNFTAQNGKVVGFELGSASYTADFNKLSPDKPIYLRIRTDYNSGDDMRFGVSQYNYSELQTQVAALNTSVTAENASKSDADAFYASELRYAASAEAEAAASKIYFDYYTSAIGAAESFKNAVDALPDINNLIYQDKTAIESARAIYNSLNDAAKALVTDAYNKLLEYEAAAKNLVYDGHYRTSDGTSYRIDYNESALTLGSDTNGALTVKINGDSYRSTAESGLSVVTDQKYPIVSGKYEMSQYFGTLDGSGRFGFIADYEEDNRIFEGKYNNSFVLYRTESGNTNTIYTLVDGKTEPCAVISGTTRNRLWLIGVAKVNGSWYVTLDGKALTGEGYSDAVQSSLKLENHFSREFLENNYSVHFFMYASSMQDGAYLRPTVTVENNLILDTRDLIGDRNGGSAAITDKNTANSSVISSDTANTYTFDVPSAGGVTLAEPLNTAGFTIKATLSPVGGVQNVGYTFSNDPTFTSGNEMYMEIWQLANSTTNQIVYNNSVQGEKQFGGFYMGTNEWEFSFVENNGKKNLRVYLPGNELIVQDYDFTEMLKSPVYIKITGGGSIEPNIILKNSVNDAPAFTDIAALNNATEAYLANEAVQLAKDANEQIDAIYADRINFRSHYDAAVATRAEINGKKNGLSARQQNAYKTAELNEIIAYYEALADANAESLASLRKQLLGVESETVEKYDYYHDDDLNILDLIRIKKASSEKKN